MKIITAALFLFLSLSPLAQIQYSEPFKAVPHLIKEVGFDENYAIYVQGENRNPKIGRTYIKVDMSKGNTTFIETPAVKIDDKLFRLWKSAKINDEIIELYLKYNGQALFFIKRSIDDLKIQGEPIKILDYSNEKLKISPNIYISESGIFVHTVARKGDIVKSASLKIFDTELNMIQSSDITEFYPDEEKSLIKKVYHSESGYIIFNLNLNKIKKDNKMFSLNKPKTEESTLGLLVYDLEGNQHAIIPEFKGSFLYSNIDFFIDQNEDLVGIFCTHEKAENTYNNYMSGASRKGTGYSFYKWNLKDEELLISQEKTILKSDIYSKEHLELLMTADPKGKYSEWDLSQRYLGTKTFKTELLPTGDYLLTFSGPNYYSASSKFYLCLDKDGRKKWGTFHSGLFDYGKHEVGVDTKENQYIIAHYGKSSNYPNSKYKFTSLKGKWDLICLSTLDLETGKIITRKSIDPKDKKLFFRTPNLWNEEAKKILFVTEKETDLNSQRRTILFGVYEYPN